MAVRRPPQQILPLNATINDKPNDQNFTNFDIDINSLVLKDPGTGPVITNFNEIFLFVLGYIYPNIESADLTRLKSEFVQLNDSLKYELLSGIVLADGTLTPEFISLINADHDIKLWGFNNGYQENPDWKHLVEELSVIQLNSLVKKNVTDLFKAIANKLRRLNQIIEKDKGVLGPDVPGLPGAVAVPGQPGDHRVGPNPYRNKYLKYKQKYLKLKNNKV